LRARFAAGFFPAGRFRAEPFRAEGFRPFAGGFFLGAKV